MGFKVHFREVAFQRTDPDNPLIALGDPEIFRKGDDVPDWAPPAIVAALAQSGMILPVADRDDAPIVDDAAPAVPNPEILPSVFAPGGTVTATETAGDPQTTTVVERPKDSDTKPLWEAYAESIGIDRAEAESLTKPKLQARVAEREAEIEAGKAPAA